MKVFQGDFNCPVCAQNEKRDFVHNATNINELGFILRCLPLENVKKFILNQIDNNFIDASLPFLTENKSLINTLSDNMIQTVFSFDDNRSKLHRVSKKWNQILQKMNCMETKQKYQTIKEQIKCDKKEK